MSGHPWPLWKLQNASKADTGVLVWTCCVPRLFSHLVILSPAHTAGPARTGTQEFRLSMFTAAPFLCRMFCPSPISPSLFSGGIPYQKRERNTLLTTMSFSPLSKGAAKIFKAGWLRLGGGAPSPTSALTGWAPLVKSHHIFTHTCSPAEQGNRQKPPSRAFVGTA